MIDREGFVGRLRERRVELGLSQTELAGDQISSSYISLLEAGKRVPTEPILAFLAERLNCTVSYLLEGRKQPAAYEAKLRLEYAELALRNGEAPDALTKLDVLLADGSTLGTDLSWRARRLQAEALEAVGQLEGSLAVIEALRAEAEAGGGQDEYLRLTIAAVRCYKELGDLGYAIDIGERSLASLDADQLGASDVHADSRPH